MLEYLLVENSADIAAGDIDYGIDIRKISILQKYH